MNIDRKQVLARLWEIANMSPEVTRNSVAGQVKALSIIVAMQNFIAIADRLAVAADKNPPTPPLRPQIYTAAWLRTAQQAGTSGLQPTPALPQQEDAPGGLEPEPAPGVTEATSPGLDSSIPGSSPTTFATPVSPSQPQPPASYAPASPTYQTQELPSR